MTKIRRLFIDIETTPNIVFSWRVGYQIDLTPQNIIEERKVAVICWKWEGDKVVRGLHWDGKRRDDKKMLEQFAKVLEQADEVVAQNGDRFDLPWIRARCAYHGIKLSPIIKSIDTLKWAKGNFYFNSNKLDYLGKFLGVGGKDKTGTSFELWKDVWEGDNAALTIMLRYCKRDVQLLEDVYQKLAPYVAVKTHAGVFMGKDRISCNQCGSDHLQSRGQRISAQGYKTRIFQCQACGRWSNVPQTVVNTAIAKRDKLDGKKSKGKE